MVNAAFSALVFIISVLALVHSEDVFRFANMYGDHMVLEQAPKRAVIWGFGEVGERVILTLSGTRYSATMEGNGMWQVALNPTKHGGPYVITAESMAKGRSRRIELKDVLFGDVWICSGQSNMEFAVDQSDRGDSIIRRAAKYSDIRLFTASHHCAEKPQDELRVRLPWSRPSPASVGKFEEKDYQYFSAVCWSYGLRLYRALGYPIGLVVTAREGTSIEAWMSEDALRSCNSTNNYKGQHIFKPIDRELFRELLYSCLWNGMIHPLLKMTIHGVIWYQGETNGCVSYLMPYKCSFLSMVDDWRAKWHAASNGNTDLVFPFGFVQLSGVGTDITRFRLFCNFPPLRWAQTAGYGYVPNPRERNMFMAVSIDLGNLKSKYLSLHPTEKRLVGFRLALAARGVVYGERIYHTGPLVSRVKRVDGGGALQIIFRSLRKKIQLRNTTGFEVKCKNKINWVQAPVKGYNVDSVFIKAVDPCVPEKVRYAWSDYPCQKLRCAVYSGNLPSPPFMIDVPVST